CVKLARHRKTNEQVAVKIISKASLVNRAAVHRGIEREIAIMKLINHPHVIRLYDVYETEKELFLVMEYVSGGELFEYLVNKGRLDEAEALRFFQQIIVGLAFCHKRKICHRDLKPENLLLDDRMNVKIADFGMASLQTSGRLLETSCGSPHYASPEVVTGMKYDGSSSDIWSCGIILYALLTGHLPFDDENIRQLLSKVKAGKFYMPTDISAGARDLISRMLTVNPKRRITMQGVIMHPWFRMVNPERNTLGEPEQDPKNGRAMQVTQLDGEILRHMRWLFAPGPSHSDPEAKEVFDEEALLLEIQEKMTSKEENMEKLFYHLLCQHKTELLENYSGDECDSLPDAPRRRADSFPNSGASSLRSTTPEFGRTTLPTRDLPALSLGSPSTPAVKGIDPVPLTLNSESEPTASTSIHPGCMSEARRGQSPTKMHRVNSTKDEPSNTSGMPEQSTRRHSQSQESRDAIVSANNHEATASKSLKKDDSGRGKDVVKDDSKSTISTKLSLINGAIQESAASANTNTSGNCHHKYHQKSNSGSMTGQRNHPLTPTPPLTTAQLPPLPYSGNEEDKKKALLGSEDSTTLSIESQVMSTQISEISHSSSSGRSTPVALGPGSTLLTQPMHQQPVNVNSGVGVSSNSSSTEKLKSAESSIRGQRPMLHPLDVKASAGMTVTNVSVPQHSRKYSEGTSSVISTTPLSPRRPWFTRLFDFKPQPLMFKSDVSAVEAQERVETILKSLFESSIQIDAYKKPAFGVKCRYEGGVIDDQTVKAVKFKVDISEKTIFLPVTPDSRSNSSRNASSSAVTEIMTNADLQHSSRSSSAGDNIQINAGSNTSNRNNTHCAGISNNGPSGSSSSASSSSSSAATSAANFASAQHKVSGTRMKKASHILAGRRASDGGSILSSAAAAVTSHFAAKKHFHSNANTNSHSNSKHRHSVHGIHSNTPVATDAAAAADRHGKHKVPPQMQMRRVVKVTLHQQQGANSTLRMIYERLCATWDVPFHLLELGLDLERGLDLEQGQELGQHQHFGQLPVITPRSAAPPMAAR
ncbi:hypothetical protein BGZ98_009145, partial [Dissophora globulifera]